MIITYSRALLFIPHRVICCVLLPTEHNLEVLVDTNNNSNKYKHKHMRVKIKIKIKIHLYYLYLVSVDAK